MGFHRKDGWLFPALVTEVVEVVEEKKVEVKTRPAKKPAAPKADAEVVEDSKAAEDAESDAGTTADA